MKPESIISREDLKTLSAARRILAKIDRRIAYLEENRETPDGERWMKMTEKLYNLLDVMYKKGYISTVKCAKLGPNDLVLLYK